MPLNTIEVLSDGKMAEWSNAAVLKTVELRGSGGSNPSLSAKEQKNIRSAFRTPLFFIHFEAVRQVVQSVKNSTKSPTFIRKSPPRTFV